MVSVNDFVYPKTPDEVRAEIADTDRKLKYLKPDSEVARIFTKMRNDLADALKEMEAE